MDDCYGENYTGGGSYAGEFRENGDYYGEDSDGPYEDRTEGGGYYDASPEDDYGPYDRGYRAEDDPYDGTGYEDGSYGQSRNYGYENGGVYEQKGSDPYESGEDRKERRKAFFGRNKKQK